MFADMALSEPLNPKAAAKHTRASIFYGADQYLEELKKKYEHDHEIASLQAEQGGGNTNPNPP